MLRKSKLSDFAVISKDKLRFVDTDRHGHINNSVFSSIFETGRAEILIDPKDPLYGSEGYFVICRSLIEFIGEMQWPGEVNTGTRVASIGSRSLALEQAIFQNGKIVATSETQIVYVDAETRRSKHLPQKVVDSLLRLKAANYGQDAWARGALDQFADTGQADQIALSA